MSLGDAARLRPAWVEIDLDAVRHNVGVARRLAAGAKIYAVCKGDGYGGGAVEVALAAVAGGAEALAVGSPVDAWRFANTACAARSCSMPPPCRRTRPRSPGSASP